jgi:RNA polymerase sigma factor (sigma-70 family)
MQIDSQLLPFLNAQSEAESQAALEQLICNQAQPLVKDIISFKLRASSAAWSSNRDAQEVEDVSSEVIVKLVSALRECKSAPAEKPIGNLRSYVAVMAYNASDAYLRQKYPRRFSLKNKIKYVLTHHPGLSLWETEGGAMLCGFSAWRQMNQTGAGARRSDTDRTEIRDFLLKKAEGRALGRMNPGEQIAAVCEYADSPLEIDDLVTIMAEIWGVRDAPPPGSSDDSTLSALSDPTQRFDSVLDHQARIKEVWNEMVQLPLRQRVALLLNLRDEQGGSAIAMLPILRIASIQQIAEALEMPDQEMAVLWNELPMEDAAIGKRLGATRQQVSNLRKCARERLSRRLAAMREDENF